MSLYSVAAGLWLTGSGLAWTAVRGPVRLAGDINVGVTMDEWTFWALWAVGFAAAMLLLYKFVPVRRARKGATGTEVGTRDCHECGAPIARSSAVCPSCGATSMAVHERMCPECKQESNPLEHPDPLNDIPEGVEVVEN
jgi:hypothetical protein